MRERPLIILWLDNLGIFYPLIAELGLTHIAAAFKGGAVVRHMISVPSVTESAKVVVKTGCGLDQLPMLGEQICLLLGQAVGHHHPRRTFTC